MKLEKMTRVFNLAPVSLALSLGVVFIQAVASNSIPANIVSPSVTSSGGINIIPEVRSWMPTVSPQKESLVSLPASGFKIFAYDYQPNTQYIPYALYSPTSAQNTPGIAGIPLGINSGTVLANSVQTAVTDLGYLGFKAFGVTNQLSSDCLGKAQGGICLRIVPSLSGIWVGSHYQPNIPSNTNEDYTQNLFLIDTQGYELDLGNLYEGEIDITAATPEGVFYGMQSLTQLLEQGSVLPVGLIQDWPDVTERSVMLDTGRHYFSASYIQYLLRLMALYKLNTFHWHLTDWNAFRLDDPKTYPGLASSELTSPSGAPVATKDFYSYSDVQTILKMADQYHIMVVPEIDVPGHSERLTNYYAAQNPGKFLSFDPAGSCGVLPPVSGVVPSTVGNYQIGGIYYPGWTVDVTNPDALPFVEGVVKNFMPWFSNYQHLASSQRPSSPLYQYQGKYFHLGADEYPKNTILQSCPALVNACYANGDITNPKALKPECGCGPVGSPIPACQVPSGTALPVPVPGGLFVDFLDQIDADIFESAQNNPNPNNPDQTKMRIWTGWNAASSPGNKYASSPINPNNDIAIDAWLITQDLNQLTQAGFAVNNASFVMTYLTPGFAGQNWDFPPPENYLLNNWSPEIFVSPSAYSSVSSSVVRVKPSPNFLGAGFQVWTDGAIEKSDLYFDTLLERPLKLMANATWSGGSSQNNLGQFIQNASQISQVPGFALPAQQVWCLPKNTSEDLGLAQPVSQLRGFSSLTNDLSQPWTIQAQVKFAPGALDGYKKNQTNLVLTQSNLSEDPTTNILQLDLAQFAGVIKGVSPIAIPGTGSVGYMNGVDNCSGYQAGAAGGGSAAGENCFGAYVPPANNAQKFIPDSPVGSYSLAPALPVSESTPVTKTVTYVGDRSGISLYINGKFQSENNSVMSLPLGLFGQNGPQGQVMVQGLMITNRALSASEINNAIGTYCP